LGKWAEYLGVGSLFHQAVYRAFFVEGRNIGLVEELASIAASVGLSAEEARLVLETGSFSSVVDDDWQRARELHITSVPTHIYEGKKLAGFGPYDDFVRLIGKE
jgi:predicted DsbA family dithiol-disulfide isomerase